MPFTSWKVAIVIVIRINAFGSALAPVAASALVFCSTLLITSLATCRNSAFVILFSFFSMPTFNPAEMTSEMLGKDLGSA